MDKKVYCENCKYFYGMISLVFDYECRCAKVIDTYVKPSKNTARTYYPETVIEEMR